MRGKTKIKFKNLLIQCLQEKNGRDAYDIAKYMTDHTLVNGGVMGKEVGGLLRDKKTFHMIEVKQVKRKNIYFLKEGFSE